MENFKLIGGSADGMLIGIEKRPYPPRITVPPHATEYHRWYLAGDLEIHPCYAAAGMNRDDILRKLLAR